jgi:tetratricopeptide (TPR) repeat protein
MRDLDAVPAPPEQVRSAPTPAGSASIALLALAVAAIVAAVLWPVLGSRAIALDDPSLIVGNVLVLYPNVESVRRFFSEVLAPSTMNAYYMPLSMTSLMLDAAAGGSATNLAPFHATSLALHAVAASMLFLLLRRLTGSSTAAALAALAWGAHPVMVEAVASAGERKTVLADVLAFASAWAFVRGVQTGGRVSRWGSVALFALALLAKPSVMTLPVALLLLGAGPLANGWRRSVRTLMPHFGLAAVSAVISVLSVRATWQFGTPPPLDPVQFCLESVWLVGFYARQLVWPAQLSIVYEPPAPFTLANPAMIAGALAALVILTCAWVLRRRAPAAWIGSLVFLVLLAPTFGILTYSPVIAYDRYLHLPLLGIAYALAAGVGTVWGRAPSGAGGSRAWLALVLAMIAAEAWAARAALEPWRDSLALWSRAVEISPGMAMAYNGLGATWSDAGDRGRAIAAFERAALLDPGLGDAHQNLGRELLLAGRAAEALPQLEIAARLAPRSAAAAHQLGNGFAATDRFQDAEREYRRALELRPGFAPALSSLGVLLVDQGRSDEGLQRLREAVPASGGASRTRFALAVAIGTTSGPTEEMVALLEGVLRDTPGDLLALNDLAWLRATSAEASYRDTSLALTLSQHALELGGAADAGVLDTRAAAEAAAGRFIQASATAERAIALARASGDDSFARQVATRLAGYREGRAYVQPRPAHRP